ncbi:MAG: methyl-accepting chemotaxis protein [Paucibacter sp.]|nr:methyl-accepting chemotaxis protein [Roseateles sp.]
MWKSTTLRVKLIAAFTSILMVAATASMLAFWELSKAESSLALIASHNEARTPATERAQGSNAALLAATVADVQRAQLVLMAALGLSVLGGIVLSLKFSRDVQGILGAEPEAAAEHVAALASGNLSRPTRLAAGDEASLMAKLVDMQARLGQMVTKIRANADSVATASAQIAQGNLDLSARTEQQASALQQTAATMEQLTATVRNNADSAQQANQLALGAAAVATQGGEVVGRVVGTMQSISDSSRRIGDITGVIDGIAFQTNILALNAAVEAARAGEQGRGFAVVAGEVRSLAQRSAEAAREIKRLITSNVEQVEQGAALVDQAGRTIGEIVSSVQRVSDLVAEISVASAEQSSGISQVCSAVSEMDRGTQQNAALVEESAAAAESLEGQARLLVQAVAAFTLNRTGASAMTPVASVAPVAVEASGTERRGPDRASNIVRSAFGAKGRATPASQPVQTYADTWASF